MRDDLKLAAFAVANGFTLDTDRAGASFGPDIFDAAGVPHDGLQFQRKGVHVWDTARGWRVAAMAGDRFEPQQPEQFHANLFKALNSAIARGDAIEAAAAGSVHFGVQHWRDLDADWLERHTARRTCPDGKPFLVSRVNSAGEARPWSWHSTKEAGVRAARRARLREIPTR